MIRQDGGSAAQAPLPRPAATLLALAPHTNGVGAAFHPATVSSNQVNDLLRVCGCCPASARRTTIRCSASARLSHEPESGV